jgi:putative heme-binding domain-containing protein
MEFARALRVLKTGWTLEQRKAYLQWFLKAANYKGGNSLAGFFKIMRDDAIATLSSEEKTALKTLLDVVPEAQTASVQPPRPFVKKWTLEELLPMVERGLTERDFDRGRAMFAAANCFACHRFAGEGGSNGPDLTALAGRFSAKDLLESVVEPSKVISDQYASVVIRQLDGQVVTGRITNLKGDELHINTDMLNPSGIVKVSRQDIDEMRPSTTSMMPAGLLDTLNEEKLKDLLAFLLSRGNRADAMFRQ